MEEDFSLPCTSRTLRFGDNPGRFDGETNNCNNSDSESLSDAADHYEPELQSMAGMGIMHLCSELLELKRVSDEDFHRNLFLNYSAFLSIFQEVEGVKKELIQLKKHVSIQKQLVKGLTDGVDINVLPEDSVEYTVEDHFGLEPSSQSLLKAHTENVCEVLDVLLSEKRVDEALEILESEAVFIEDMQSQGNLPMDEFTCYTTVLLEKRAKTVNQLKLVAENPRVSPAELLKNLIRLCRVGDSRLATSLLLQYYHSRIVSGMHELQYVKSANGVSIQEAAKFAFSMISQAAKTFLVINGEQSSYFLDLVQWANEETEVFAACFNKYVQSLSDINGGMVTVLDALQSALSYSSLLETERLVLNPCLVKHIRPSLEEFLLNHIDHFKIVIRIFTSADSWVVGRYLLSGILGKDCSSVVSGEQPEYCLLSSSGWKLVTVFQAIAGYVVPLLAIQLEGHILRGLMDLYTQYVSLLESALSCKLNNLDEIDPAINLAETPQQQVSLLANLSSLALLLSNIIRSAFNSIPHLTFEADNTIRFIHESPEQLRGQLCQEFVSKVMDGSGGRLIPETWVGGEGGSDQLNDMMPSPIFQELFYKLKALEQLAEDNFVEVNWLLEVIRELMMAVFISILNNKELWKNIAEELASKHSGNLKQFVLDMRFLIEIAKHGGYFCNDIMGASSSILSHMEAAFISAGFDPERATIEEEWAIEAAKEALQKLQEMTEILSPPNETIDNLEVKIEESRSVCASDESPKIEESGSVCASDGSRKLDLSPQGIVHLMTENFGDNRIIKSGDPISDLGDTEDGIGFDTTNTEKKIEHMESLQEQWCQSDDGETYGEWSEEDETRSQHDASELVIVKVENLKIKSAETSSQV